MTAVPSAPPASAAPRSRRWPVAAVAFLLSLHVFLALWAASGESVTYDELLHVTGGFFYDRFGDYRIQPENGNLPQRLAGLPAVLDGAPAPGLAGNIYWDSADATVIGYQFFYGTGHDHGPMLGQARALMMIFSIGTGLLVYWWARRLFGPGPALLALTFYALDPNVLAHAPLATSDSAAVFFLLASVTAYWVHLQAPDWRNTALSALTFGLACVAKYSAVLLLPMFLLLCLWRVWRETPGGRKAWRGRILLSTAAHGGGAWLVIWACYGFRYSGFAPELSASAGYLVPWTQVLPFLGWQRPVVEFCRQARLLPEAFLYGYSWVIYSAQARSAFLAGDYGSSGWMTFFPLAFCWKTPLALLATLPLGVWALIRRWWHGTGRWREDLTAVAPLLALFTVYWGFSLTAHLNIGHRHLLPIYPPLFILAGALAVRGALAGWMRNLAGPALVAALLAANVRVAPHYLAFFNALAGGPANGWRLLVDSSLDWGQDLPGLKKWLEANNTGPSAQPVFLSYFGSGEPRYYDIHATWLPFVNGFKFVHRRYEMGAGLYCISATMLQHVYSPLQGPWTPERERDYRRLQAIPLKQMSDDDWFRYDLLRFARLCAYLRMRPPEAMVGYSIFLYRLSPEEIDTALNGSPGGWLGAIERARSHE